ncbi:MAG: hypothetical protein K7J47_16795 [Acidobacteria bacterium]|nr:hypothetical protein [Bryobacteraceae bacterium CoA2 C42]
MLSVAGEIIAYEYSEVLFRSFEPTMKIVTFLLPLAFTGALSLFAQGAVSHAPSLPGAEGIAVDAGNSTAGSGAAQSIVPIPDCFPCSEDNDPYSEGPADYPPIPFPKPPGLPKCYPICNLEGGVAADEPLIVPIPDCFPCSEDNDPYSEGPADYPPIPFPKPPGLPKCYPICNLDGGPDSSLSPSPLAGVVPRGDSAPVVRQINAVPAIEPSSVLRRSRLSRG